VTGEALYHVDGDLVDAQSAVLHVDHRGVVFGDAVTATVRTAGGTPFAWDRHATRLFDACDAVGIDPDVDEATLRDRIEETLAANDLEAALADLSIVRGRGRGDTTATRPLAARYAPGPDTESTVVVRVTPVAETHRPITLQTVRTRSIPPDAVPASHLTHNRLDAVRASAELRRAAPPDGDPADEALVLDDEGTVVGGTASDPGFVDADAIRLPALGDRTPRTVM
jgi:branched-chain amino acid aminotransferase